MLTQANIFLGERSHILSPMKNLNQKNMQFPIFSSNRFKVLTPSDTAKQTYTCASVTGDPGSPKVIPAFKYLYITVTGDVVVNNDAGSAITFSGVTAGTLLPVTGNMLKVGTSATVVGIF
jgi:hypothetical protein